MKLSLENKGNGISDTLKIKIFWGSLTPIPRKGLTPKALISQHLPVHTQKKKLPYVPAELLFVRIKMIAVLKLRNISILIQNYEGLDELAELF